jgi:hypothetical protein
MEYPDQAWQCFAMRCLYMVRKVTSFHPETVFLPDPGVAPLPKNAHVPTYAPFFRRSRALVSNKILVSGWTLTSASFSDYRADFPGSGTR